MKEPVSVLWSLCKAQTKSSMFIASFTESFLYILCLTNSMGVSDHPFIVYIAGFCCGLSCLFEPKERRKELAVYCATRAGEIVNEFGHARKYWHKERMDYFFVLMFSVSMGGLMYYYHREPKHIKAFVHTIMKLLLGY